MPIHKPHWFSDDHVMISTAPTCGLTKGGRLLRKVDPDTGHRVQTTDADTGALVDAIDDRLLADMEALSLHYPRESDSRDVLTETLRFISNELVKVSCAIPAYYDRRFTEEFHRELTKASFEGYSSATLAELARNDVIEIRGGHGSPSQEQRVGDIPYIKVSDLRAGLVNINPTNRVPRSIAAKFWRGPTSGLNAYDLICPERTSKNIGDFCVLMPGQEQILTTKEIIVLRPGRKADFDAFYLLWAMTLKVVRDQWKRVIFMQTNREDVGKRYLEIEIPIAPNAEIARTVSQPFREYFTAIASARSNLQSYLAKSESPHHFFVAGGDSDVGEA